MNALLKKDFYMNVANFLIIFISLPFFYVLKISPHFMYLVLIYTFAWGLAYYDDLQKVHAYLASLPLTREQIVRSRYLFIILSGIATGVYCIALDQIFRVFLQIDTLAFTFNSLFVMFCLGILLISFALPFFYRFRFTVSIILQIIFFNVLVTVGVFTVRFIFEHEIVWLVEFAEWLYLHYHFSLSFVTGLFLVLSYFVSVRIFVKKDLP